MLIHLLKPLSESHPAWVCGLKHRSDLVIHSITRSHPAWVCGLKPVTCDQERPAIMVTPCVGVWIETNGRNFCGAITPSHPAWVCGLKLTGEGEMLKSEPSHPAWVCGLKHPFNVAFWRYSRSHPAWVCGLKLICERKKQYLSCHTLRGCVD